MTTAGLQDWATLAAAVVALSVFVFNSVFQLRNRRIENLSRFIEAHKRLFVDDGYIMKNIGAMNAGTLIRDFGNLEMEQKFHNMLLEVERLALLGNNKAVPPQTQVYMFGWYARHMVKLVSDAERGNMFWELALAYLNKLAERTSDYERLSQKERAKFWR